MKNWIYKLFTASLAIALIYGCTPEIDVPSPSTGGDVDFSNYIAVGNSLTAGYADGGLYADGQMQSYPNMIAQQISEITPIDFVQPDIPGNGSGYTYLASLAPTFGVYDADANWLNQVTGPFNNLGVPGIRVKDIEINGYGSSPQVNAYFYRMLGGKDATTSYLDVVSESNATFFTCWMGNNDVLGYATSGGAYGIDGIASANGLYGLTPVGQFEGLYDDLMNALEPAEGIVITIPDVTNVPFFTTVAWNGLELDAATAQLATQYYAYGIDTAVQKKVEVGVIYGAATQGVYQGAYEVAYEAAIDSGKSESEAAAIATATAEAYVASADGQAAIAEANLSISDSYYGLPEDQRPNHPLYPTISATKTQTIAYLSSAGLIPTFTEGNNAFIIEVPVTEANPLGFRKMIEGEYMLLTALASGQLSGTNALVPKPDKYILTAAEVANVREYTDAYNNIIRSHVSEGEVGLVDADELLESVNDGIFQDGVTITGDFVTGGAFSLDAVHLTPRGYAVVANSIISEINSTFDANISPVIVNNHRAVVLP